MTYLPTLYKARKVPTKQAVCAICVERTRGRTQLLRLPYGVSIWLCADHASHEFQTQRNGRDFVLTLHRLWHAHGCLTAARGKALNAHTAALRERSADRMRPGSYAWPELRRQVEARFANGAHPRGTAERVRDHLRDCPAHPPSPRTIRRWHTERRWLAHGPPR
jgi:hypothetical protein